MRRSKQALLILPIVLFIFLTITRLPSPDPRSNPVKEPKINHTNDNTQDERPVTSDAEQDVGWTEYMIKPDDKITPPEDVVIYFIFTEHIESTWGSSTILCSIEATCKAHPFNVIKILHVQDLHPIPTKNYTRWIQLKKECPKLEFERYRYQKDIDRFPALKAWWAKHKSGVAYNGLSDLLRYLLLYTRGGLYLDPDFVPFKSLLKLQNVVGEERPTLRNWDNPSIINGAVLKFERGSEFMLRLLQAVTRVESTKGWATLGPELLTDVFYSQFYEKKPGVNRVDVTAFYALFWRDTDILLRDKDNEDVLALKALLKAAYGIHLWSSITRQYIPSQSSFYHELMTQYCPITLIR